MIITAFFDDRIETLTLPQKPAGHYVLGALPAAFIDGRDGCWLLTPAGGLTVSPTQEALDPGTSAVTLSCPGSYLLQKNGSDPRQPGSSSSVPQRSGGSLILLLTEPADPERG
ncbi:MAG: hypothetical protein J5865_01190, partial [Lachnospiraceae bacterium]|nr:hypothetical protein [Lachnospiraceae bacterium]